MASLERLEPGQAATPDEQWEFFTDIDSPSTHQGIQELIRHLPTRVLSPLGDAELFETG